MAKELNDRLQSYLAAEEPRRPLFSASVPRTQISTKLTPNPSYQFVQPSLNRSPSDTSTISSTESYKRSDTSTFRQSSKSSFAATSITEPPWHPPTFIQHINMHPYNHGYDLPCEFFFVDCNLRFDPENYEAWISHTASHFRGVLPTKAICTFCDDDQAIFRSNGDDAMNWRERMLHILGHLEDLTPSEHIRPDFWIIEHMGRNGLISPEDYAHALNGTERPPCENLYPLDYELPEAKLKTERDLQQRHDLAKEKKQMRGKGKTGKSKSTHGDPHSHKPQKSYHIQINLT